MANILEEPIILEMAAKYKKNPGQVCFLQSHTSITLLIFHQQSSNKFVFVFEFQDVSTNEDQVWKSTTIFRIMLKVDFLSTLV